LRFLKIFGVKSGGKSSEINLPNQTSKVAAIQARGMGPVSKLYCFDAINITSAPREVNHRADNLATSVAEFSPPNLSHLSYSVKVMHRPAIPDNLKQWQVFKEKEQIKRFLLMVGEYTNIKMNSDGED